MSSGGHAASSSGCAIRPRVQEIGSTGSVERIPSSSPTGRYAMETAEQWEPYESRGSRTVLGEPGGESPPGHSSISSFGPCAGHFRSTPMNGHLQSRSACLKPAQIQTYAPLHSIEESASGQRVEQCD